MQQKLSLKLLPSEAASTVIVKEYIAKSTGAAIDSITGFYLLKKSIDARGKQPWVNLSVEAFINEPFINRTVTRIEIGRAHV